MAEPDAFGLQDPRMQEFIANYASAWSDPTRDKLERLWVEEGEYIIPEHAEPLRGRDEIVGFVEHWLGIAPDLRLKPIAAAENGDTLFIQYRARGRFDGSVGSWEVVTRFDLAPDSGRARRGESFITPPPVIEVSTKS
jgi:SnoaL-like protein